MADELMKAAGTVAVGTRNNIGLCSHARPVLRTVECRHYRCVQGLQGSAQSGAF